MKTIGVLISMVVCWPLWGGAAPDLTLAPVSFQLVCPHDVHVDCQEDITDLSKWGDAYVWKDYVKISAGTPIVDDKRNACGIGEVTRTWRVQDPHSIWHTCTQVITVTGGGNFSYHDITWPESWTVDTCSINLHPGSLPRIYGYPKFARVDCAMPAYSYSDEIFDFGPNCQKLIRTWKVIDWCTYKIAPGSTMGKWENVQIIKIIKGDRPTIDCPKDTVFYAQNCDSADVELEDIYVVNSCGDSLLVTNTSPHADFPGNNASGKYPVGTYEFYYVADYGCGSEVKCKMKVTVKDAKPPTPYCKNGIITTLMPMDTNSDGSIDDGMREVWASDLNAGSYHDCYPNMKLTYSFSADTSDKVRTYTCQNVGSNDVEIWVTDENGNQAYCLTYIIVQSNNPNIPDCEPDSLKTGTIAGAVAMVDGRTIEEVEMELFGYNAAFDVKTVSDTTFDQNGKMVITIAYDTAWFDITKRDMSKKGSYSFQDLIRFKDYEVRAFKTSDRLNGVDVWDYYSLYFYLERFYQITDPQQLIAADIDGNGIINRKDENLLLTALLSPGAHMPEFESWRFFDRGSLEEYISNSSADPDKMMAISGLFGNKTNVDFSGIKIGDLDGNANPAGISAPKDQSIRSREVIKYEVEASEDGLLLVNFEEKLHAVDLMMNIPMEDIELIHNSTTGRSSSLPAGDGMRLVVIDVEGFDQLMFRSHDCVFDIEEAHSVVFDKAGKSKSLTESKTKNNRVTLIKWHPNPVRDQMTIEFMSMKSQSYILSVYNSLGQSMLTQGLGSFDSGLSSAQVDVSHLPAGEAYIFKLAGETDVSVGQFIK
jgi:hypothetical protein